MMGDPTSFWLSALVWVPAAGALVVLALDGRLGPKTHDLAIAVSGLVWIATAYLLVSGPVTTSATIGPFTHLGASYSVGLDGPSSILVTWVALAALLALIRNRQSAPERRCSSAQLLFLEASTLGLLVARDGLLLLSFYGLLVISAAAVSGAASRVIAWQFPGLGALCGGFAFLYRRTWEQTGFASTDLSRLRELVWYPDERLALGLASGLIAVLLLPAIFAAMARAPASARALLLSSVGLVPSYLFVRVAVPLAGLASLSAGRSLGAMALGVAVVAALRSGWTGLFVAYQGLFLFGLCSLGTAATNGVLLTLLGSLAGFVGLLFTRSRPFSWGLTVFLMSLPLLTIVLPLWRTAPVSAVSGLAVVGFVSIRLVQLVRSRASSESAEPILVIVPILLWCLSMVVGAVISPAALERPLVGAPTEAEP